MGGDRRPLIGGYQPQDLNLLGAEERSGIDAAAANAIEMMNDVKTEGGVSNAMPLELKEIVSVETQAVAGLNYKFELKVQIDGKTETCHLVVTNLYMWDNGGTWSMEAKNPGDPCAPFIPGQKTTRRKRSGHLLGGVESVDKDDDMVQEAAKWAVEHMNKMSNSLFRHGLLKISQVTKQVVNGIRYKFLLTVVSTSCRNNEENRHKTLEECPANENPMPQDCNVSVVYSQAEYTMEDFTCKARKATIGGDDHDYKPHGMIGGDDHDYKPHGMIGGDDHDYKPHGSQKGLLGRDKHDYVQHGPGRDAVKHMSILGGDTHDYVPHDKCAQHMSAFQTFKVKYNRVYGNSEEESHRFQVFCDNMEKVKKIQAAERGSAVYGATKFADLSEEEFKKFYLGFKPSTPGTKWPQAKIPTDPIPESWDWRDHNAVTPVKNQGWCGSCWAFSTTGNIEGQWAIHSPQHELLSLSEQELVDCDKIDQGCSGGFMYDAYKAIMNLGGLETEGDYKYTGHDDKCQFDKSEVAVKLTGAVNISKDEGEMAAWLYNNGPIAIGINSFPMQFYFWGIAHPWKFFCDPNALDHGVLIVGYGKKGNEPYWIIKNSWGEDWGRDGYYYIYRGDGSCGLNTMCSSATVN